MVKIKVECDEYYPYYTFSKADKDWKHVEEVTEEQLKNWNKVMKKFHNLQDELQELHKKFGLNNEGDTYLYRS